MYSRCLSLLATAIPLIAATDTLRVCADPNNLPFSNQRGQGFENRLARIVARDLSAKLEFVWWNGRRSLVKNTLDDGKCDALMGVPSTLDSVALTHPYYRSTYVFVSRQDRNLRLTSLNDARLASYRIGIHMVGDDYTPPGFALAQRGLSANVTGYRLFGTDGEPNPPARLMDAVAAGAVDVGIVWGPLAGYFATRESVALEVTPVSPASYLAVPFVYEIAMAVRKGNDALRDALNGALQRQCAEVESLLREFAVPRAPGGEERSCDPARRSPAAFWH
jgi:quinoprotein dehydrogenase-associated probable ABC transporter substrate-binding protein